MTANAWKLPALQVASDEMLHLDLLRFIASVGIVVRHSFEFFIRLPFGRRSRAASPCSSISSSRSPDS